MATRDAYGRHLASEAYRRSRARKAEVIWRLCREELDRARRVADVGAGTGLIKRALEEKADKPLMGFDIDVSFMQARERMVAADALRLPVGEGTFDLVLLNHVYEHVDDVDALFAEAFRALRPGGRAYVAAGNRLAVVEPHYRLPFLSWLPRPVADRYVRWTRRGHAYEGIRFLTRAPLVRAMERAGFEVHDRTEEAFRRLLERGEGPAGAGATAWRAAWRALRLLPTLLRRGLLRTLSPQWFFLLERVAGDRERGGGR